MGNISYRLNSLRAEMRRADIERARVTLLTRSAVALTLIWAIVLIVVMLFLMAPPANARGFDWFFTHVKPSGKCPGNEIPVSFYWSGHHTASGERFDANGNTAASRTLPFGTVIALTNPQNGKSVTVRINDRGPYGPAHNLGIKLDLAHGAAKRLGLTQTAYVCAS